MMHAMATVVLLVATCITASESFEQDLVPDSLSIEVENEHDEVAISETESDAGAIDLDEQRGGAQAGATTESAPEELPPAQPEATAALTLDELLRQARNTPHLQQEALLTRLAERRRLAIAIRLTLEAAEQVAAFGSPGAQLLQDASLDTIVASMIADQKQAEREKLIPIAPPITDQVLPQAADRQEDSATPPGFDGWQPVYVVQDARGHKIGWRHQDTGERTITYVGEQWLVGEDTVTVEGVTLDGIGRYLIVNMNGERREVHL
ncbi:MAG: hypothetical protein OXG15_06325 [Gammaproteobacteria bacterium]|nr:hypothetical protein [Gammaproteobacteria bacterium]